MSQPRKKFLFAFSDDSLAKSLSGILTRNDPEIVVVRSGQEALIVARKMMPNLVVLDRDLSDMSGAQICRDLKGESSFKSIPVVLAAHSDDERAIDECYGGHCDDVITKPFVKDQILERIYEVLKENGRKLHRAALTTRVDIEADGGTFEAKGQNINIRHFLVASPTKLNLNENYRLTFAIKKPTNHLHVWGRLEKISDPRERKVTDKDFLLLFRFLNPSADDLKQIADFAGETTVVTKPGKKSSWRSLALLISLIIAFIGVNLHYLLPKNSPDAAALSSVKLQTPIPMVMSKSKDTVIVLYLAPTWDGLDAETKKDLGQKALTELNLKGYSKMLLVDQIGNVKGTGSQEGGLILVN